QKHEAALPVVGQYARKLQRHVTFLEVLRQQREAEEEEQQVGEDHPLVGHVSHESLEPGPRLEARERELVEEDHREAGECHRQRMAVEEGATEQREAEKDEIE